MRGAPPRLRASVRMLCRRSASLIRITRRSRDIASSILRKLSAAASWRSAELQLVQLGDALDQLGHGFAELAGDGSARQRRVLDGVVQDRRDQRLDVRPCSASTFATATGWVM